jgi:tetratricopeptide (TPR) repeat protein
MAKRSKKKKRPPEIGPGNAAQTKEILPGKSSGVPWPSIPQALVIVAAVLWIYGPALQGGWLWDDDMAITGNAMIQSPTGLWSIWFEPGSQVDYYPIKASVQWLQWHLWGIDMLGYHLTNVMLHILSALLVWRLFHKFHLRLAWLGGLIFAIHPVQVESVAWITELKNTLSLPLFLLAMCAYIDYEEHGKSKDYGLALGMFLAAMLCKLSVVLFPFVILLYLWWKRGQIGWNDLKTSLPFFGVSLLLGLITIGSGIWDHRFNHTDPGAMPVAGFLARIVAAGLSVSFYFSKSFLPVALLPIYPKWTIDPSSPVQYLPWLVLGGVICWLWTKRHDWGRSALLGLGFFLINLAPCPGFIPNSDMAFAWVMNHFLYLPIIGLIGLVVAALEQLENQLPTSFRPCTIGLLIVSLALLAFQSRACAALYLNSETLWNYEIRHNPAAWLAHNNLGDALLKSGRLPEAMEQYEQALRYKPDYADAHNNLGDVFQQMGQIPEAINQYELALHFEPDNADAHNNLGVVLLQTGRAAEAIRQYEQALRINPDYANVHFNLGNALNQTGRLPEAIQQYEMALRIKPDYPEVNNNLGIALFKIGQRSQAVEQFEEALRIKPDYTAARDNLEKLQALQKTPPPNN